MRNAVTAVVMAFCVISAMARGEGPGVYKPEQAIKTLKPLYPDTPLVRGGRPQAVIVMPKDPAYTPLARSVAEKIRAATGAVVAIKADDQYSDTDRNQHLICLGQMMNNRLAFELYIYHHVASDDWYPGPEGYELRTACDPWGNGRNVIMLGGSDLDGVRRAVERFCSGIRPGQDLVIPRLMDLGFKGKEKMTQWLGDVKEEFRQKYVSLDVLPYTQYEDKLSELAGNYYLTGADEFAEAYAAGIRRWIRQYYIQIPYRQLIWPKYLIPRMILDWDMVEEHPAFDESLRLEYTNLLYDNVSRMCLNERIAGLKPGYLLDSGLHNVSLTVSVGAHYFKTYYPNLPMNQIDAGLAHVRTGLDTIKQTYGFFDENGGYTKFYPYTTMLNSLFLGDMYYFTSGNARHWLHQSLIYTDNCGGFYCGGVALSASNCMPPPWSMGEWYYRDGKWAWLLNQLYHRKDYSPTVSEKNLQIVAWSYLPRTEPVEPKEWLEGIQWLPLHETTYAQLRTMGRRVNIPRDKSYHVMSLRATYDRDAEYMRLDGINAGISKGGYGNAIVSLTARQNPWLYGGVWGSDSMQNNNTVIVLRNGQMAQEPVALCSLECVADAPSCGFVQSVMSEYNGTDWARNIIWLKRGYFVVLDTVRARESGDYSFLCQWLTNPGEMEGDTFHARRRDQALDIANAGGCQLQASISEKHEWMEVLLQAQHGNLSQGDSRTFINLLYPRAPEKESLRIGRLSPNVGVIAGPEEIALVGAVLPSGAELPATRIDARLSICARLFHLAPTRLCAADLTSLNWTTPLFSSNKPVSIELDFNSATLSVLAHDDCMLEVLGKPVAVQSKPRQVQTVKLDIETAGRTRLVEALAAHLRGLAAKTGVETKPVVPEPERANILWSYANEHASRICCAACGDVRANGTQEVAVGTADGSVALLDSVGRPVWTFKAQGRVNDLVMHDVDADGNVEVLAASDDFNLYCLDRNGKEKWRFCDAGIPLTNQAAGEYGPGLPVLSEGEVLKVLPVDLDGDGRKEVLVGTRAFKHGNQRVFGTVFCLDSAGKLMWHFYQSGGCVISIDVGEAIGDGRKEVLIGTGGGTYGRFSYLIDMQGRFIRSWSSTGYGEQFSKFAQLTPGGPIRVIRMNGRDGLITALATDGSKNPLWAKACGGLTACGPVLCDLDGDGIAEILVGSSGGSVYAVHEGKEGQGEERWHRNLMACISAVTAADVLGDDRPEVIAATQRGDIYVLDAAGKVIAHVSCDEPVTTLAVAPAKAKAQVVAGTVSGKLICVGFE